MSRQPLLTKIACTLRTAEVSDAGSPPRADDPYTTAADPPVGNVSAGKTTSPQHRIRMIEQSAVNVEASRARQYEFC
jgi:hypothetical protein